jgi:ferredoxin
MSYRVTIDKTACDGIFACMMRDDRIVESEDGLATYDDCVVREDEAVVVAEFDDARIEEARQAARACPPRAIEVEKL